MSFYHKVRSYIFKLNPETAHEIVEKALSGVSYTPLIENMLASHFCKYHASLDNEILGMRFYNPIGLAPGFDKNATMVRGLTTLGFSHLELGTITHNPQDGNPKPRLFRHVEAKSLQNAMGFNNLGVRAVINNLQKVYPFCIPLGINLGKNKNIALADALTAYELALKATIDYGDYFVFNVSSPNTVGLRDLQDVSFVNELFSMAKSLTNKPTFLKISPDMELDSMLEVCKSALSSGASGLIATNTTIDYSLVSSPKLKDGIPFGGLSGEVLKTKSNEVLKELGKAFFKEGIIVSVGGIDSASDILERLKNGASLVQILTSIIYEGPGVVKRLNSELSSLMVQEGFSNIKDVIGINVR
ncbi:dihydroorotate dehydrogenase (quinone) [Helicobacter sp. 11S02629-2]|uniref:dihydroorotate dehydrogenase (quinone) n=1 Tax=Helicobacter sp. 11S02629-2 TaxID=1476195 RepID=UPI000BA5FC40|nr:dihydroorotate dehydrogenase (quinone) [Helicobacter sp. 11S02629-2]PAF45313.1 dihydroorotate dehydrogenase (quinone) [Helicobacter sp. 11S02629-2]